MANIYIQCKENNFKNEKLEKTLATQEDKRIISLMYKSQETMEKSKKPIEKQINKHLIEKINTKIIHIKRYLFKIQGDILLYLCIWQKSKVYKTTILFRLGLKRHFCILIIGLFSNRTPVETYLAKFKMHKTI